MTAFEKLNALVGMENFKELVGKIKHSLDSGMDGKYGKGIYVFTGNPKTGKTTAANLFGELIYEMGLLKSRQIINVTRNDLVANYVGQTSLKTKELLEKALDGVLHIDEAYSLISSENDTFGREALDAILSFVDENRDKICIIFSGYPNEMDKLLQSNPGLKSRVTEIIHFEDLKS